MKFGYINDKDYHIGNNGSIRINIGEYIQFFAVHNFLKNMGLTEGEIIGDSIQGWMSGRKDNIMLVLSNVTIEEYLNLSELYPTVLLGAENFGKEFVLNQSIFNREIIGCRDEYMYQSLAECGVSNVYINGCISVTLQKREGIIGTNIYIVDVPIEILEHMPSEIKKNSIVRTHEYYFDYEIENEKLKKIAYDQYQEYFYKAKLVITSRLHLAAPCIAWGIPVILIRKNPYITFSWIDKFIPIYTPEKYDSINWHPEPVNIETEKKIMLRDMTYLVMQKYYSLKKTLDTHDLYINRKYIPENGYYISLIDGLIKELEKTYKKNEYIEYIIWGITFNAEKLYKYMKQNFNSRLIGVVDRYKKIMFHGIITKRPEEFGDFFQDKVVFVIPTGAVQEAKTFLNDKKCKKVFFVTEAFIEQKDLLTEEEMQNF